VVELADFFARQTRRKIDRLFHELWSNDDARATRVGQELLAGTHTWLERGLTPLPYTVEDLRPKTMDEILHDREQKKSKPVEEKPAAPEELRIA
jgi:hypothetical protein